MTDSKTTVSKTPSHIAYHVRNREGDKKFWTRIGSAWPHADGNGFNIQFETIPLDGRITLRVQAIPERIRNRAISAKNSLVSGASNVN